MMERELREFILGEMQKELDKIFLETVAGPAIYGEGNFVVYEDAQGEWQLKPKDEWKPTELKGIFYKKGVDNGEMGCNR